MSTPKAEISTKLPGFLTKVSTKLARLFAKVSTKLTGFLTKVGTVLTRLLSSLLCFKVVLLVSHPCLKVIPSLQVLHTEFGFKVSVLNAHTRCTVTLKLLLRILVCRLHTLSLNVTHLLAEVTLTSKPSKKLAATAISTLTTRTQVLHQLALLRVSSCFAFLDIQNVLDVRRHILLCLVVTKLLSFTHLEVF